jgi:hypothetical protein
MLPTVLLASLLIGRLWMVPVGIVTWVPAVALTTSADAHTLLAAAVLAVVNALAGVGLHRLYMSVRPQLTRV